MRFTDEKKHLREDRDLDITYRRINVDFTKNNLIRALHKAAERRLSGPPGCSNCSPESSISLNAPPAASPGSCAGSAWSSYYAIQYLPYLLCKAHIYSSAALHKEESHSDCKTFTTLLTTHSPSFCSHPLFSAASWAFVQP